MHNGYNNEDLRESAGLRDARVAIVERNVSPDRSVTFSKKVNVSGTKSRQHRKRSIEKASPSMANGSGYSVGHSTAAASSHLLTSKKDNPRSMMTFGDLQSSKFT